MKTRFIALFALAALFCCCSNKPANTQNQQNTLIEPEDRQILEHIFGLYKDDKNTPTGSLMIKIGAFLEGTPYVGQTLEAEGEEKLIVNLRGFDCTTFAETCLALSRTIRTGNPDIGKYADELTKIRYRKGKIDGYLSRLHYFSDWIFDNDKKGLIKDVSQEIAHTFSLNRVDFMSKHPESYRQLKETPELVKSIALKEQEISSRKTHFIPKNKIAEVEDLLQDGDIAGITTNISGLDISHVVILIRKAGHIHFLHASSKAGKVISSEETLEEYLNRRKDATGIMVARPLD